MIGDPHGMEREEAAGDHERETESESDPCASRGFEREQRVAAVDVGAIGDE